MVPPTSPSTCDVAKPPLSITCSARDGYVEDSIVGLELPSQPPDQAVSDGPGARLDAHSLCVIASRRSDGMAAFLEREGPCCSQMAPDAARSRVGGGGPVVAAAPLRSAYEVGNALERCDDATLLPLALSGQQPIEDEVAPVQVTVGWRVDQFRIGQQRLDALMDLREGGGPAALGGASRCAKRPGPRRAATRPGSTRGGARLR